MSLTFLVPLFLLGVAGIVVPIVVHLTRRQRRNVVLFPSLMFLQKVPYQEQRRRRIQHWFLLSLRALALACLRGEGVQRGELSISLVADDEIAELHERFMGEPGPTDVLSFGFDDEDDRAPGGAPLLGDVVISPATAVRNAAEHGNDPTGEVRLLLAHGVLHLLGYTHDEEIDRARMWERQEGYSGVRTP
ncbi:MAG: rRNA maturation RNase YbeY [Actinomycetota bacterium]